MAAWKVGYPGEYELFAQSQGSTMTVKKRRGRDQQNQWNKKGTKQEEKVKIE